MRQSLFHVNILVIFNLVTILMQGTLYNLQWKIACKAVSSICENIHFLMLDLASAPTTAILQGHTSLQSPVRRAPYGRSSDQSFFSFLIFFVVFIKFGENGKILMRKKFKRDVLKKMKKFFLTSKSEKNMEDKRKILMIERKF